MVCLIFGQMYCNLSCCIEISYAVFARSLVALVTATVIRVLIAVLALTKGSILISVEALIGLPYVSVLPFCILWTNWIGLGFSEAAIWE